MAGVQGRPVERTAAAGEISTVMLYFSVTAYRADYVPLPKVGELSGDRAAGELMAIE